MIRYWLLLLAMVAGLGGGGLLSLQLQKWRTEPARPSTAPMVAQIMAMPLPADLDAREKIIGQLTELGQLDTIRALRKFSDYQVVTRVIAATPESADTVGAAIAWSIAHPDGGLAIQQRLMRNAISVKLATATIDPPKVGRPAHEYNWDFVAQDGGLRVAQPKPGNAAPLRPAFHFVADVHNSLPVPIQSFSFYLLTADANDNISPLPLPAHSYIWCDAIDYSGGGLKILSGEAAPLLCEIRVAGLEPVEPSALSAMLNQIRAGKLHFVPWVKELTLFPNEASSFDGFRLRDHLVGAEFSHPPSANIEAGFMAGASHANARPQSRQPMTTCEERGDCLKVRLLPFTGILEQGMLLLMGALPGAILAGVFYSFAPQRPLRNFFFGTLVALSLIAFPIAFYAGGSGWGPLVYLILVVYAEAGLWTGILLGSWALPARNAD